MLRLNVLGNSVTNGASEKQGRISEYLDLTPALRALLEWTFYFPGNSWDKKMGPFEN